MHIALAPPAAGAALSQHCTNFLDAALDGPTATPAGEEPSLLVAFGSPVFDGNLADIGSSSQCIPAGETRDEDDPVLASSQNDGFPLSTSFAAPEAAVAGTASLTGLPGRSAARGARAALRGSVVEVSGRRSVLAA